VESQFIDLVLIPSWLKSCSRTKAADPFACLVADILSQTNDAVISSAFYGTYVFVPVVDGTINMARPTVTLDRQVVNGVSCAFFPSD
jgi:hypothetical protein